APKVEEILHEEVINAYHDNEAGDARLFTKLYGEKYRFDPVEKGFYLWNGKNWELDRKKTRFEDAREVAKYYEKAGLEDVKLQGVLNKRAYALKGNKRLKDVLEMATHGKDGLTFTGEWDNIPYLLPCANGVVDLRTGKLIPSSSDLSIRVVCPTEYHPEAKCPLFKQFISDIMLGNQEMMEFMQRLSGYMLLGVPMEHIFVIFWGENGRNGKGTFCGICQKILGMFARTFSSEMILLQRNPHSSGNPRADLMHLQGTRFAIFSEINKKRSVDPSQIKNLSGGDIISARALFSNEIRNFTPSHTLLIQTNYKPEAPAEDNALWRRAVLVPFEAEFWPVPTQPHHKLIDVKLEEKLLKEGSGILNWLVQGCLEYQEKGMIFPDKVRMAVESYREENNGIEIFIRDRCDKVSELSIRCSEFKDGVRAFCTEEGHRIPSPQEITQYLIKQGYHKVHLAKGDYWRGIAIKKLEE
ncbi:MAG: DNA primase, partial [Chlamydiae bacterium]|nr:DNA primase [Chlamydiota bacterium]